MAPLACTRRRLTTRGNMNFPVTASRERKEKTRRRARYSCTADRCSHRHASCSRALRLSSRALAPFRSDSAQQQHQPQITSPNLLTLELDPLSSFGAHFIKWLAEVYTGGTTGLAGSRVPLSAVGRRRRGSSSNVFYGSWYYADPPWSRALG